MYLTKIIEALISVYAPPVVFYILACILIDIVVRAFRGR